MHCSIFGLQKHFYRQSLHVHLTKLRSMPSRKASGYVDRRLSLYYLLYRVGSSISHMKIILGLYTTTTTCLKGQFGFYLTFCIPYLKSDQVNYYVISTSKELLNNSLERVAKPVSGTEIEVKGCPNHFHYIHFQ